MTNKTDKNSGTTRAGAQSQIEQASTNTTRSEAKAKHDQLSKDTNAPRKYAAILTFTQHNRARVIIEANSLAEALEKAKDIYPDELDHGDWNPFAGDIYVESVESVQGGQDNE